MHKIFMISYFFFLAVSCSGKGEESNENTEAIDSSYCNCTELVFDEAYNHFYRFERRVGFTGLCETFHPNGKVWEHKPMKEGKNHGKMITYYESGQIKEEKEFDMNFQTGEQINYDENGEVVYHALYKRGRQQEILVNKRR